MQNNKDNETSTAEVQTECEHVPGISSVERDSQFLSKIIEKY